MWPIGSIRWSQNSKKKEKQENAEKDNQYNLKKARAIAIGLNTVHHVLLVYLETAFMLGHYAVNR